MKLLSSLLLTLFCLSAMGQGGMTLLSVFEQSEGTKSATYQEGMELWISLQDQSNQLSSFKYFESDAGYPITLMVWSANGKFSPEKLREEGKKVFLINNAIHAGEPDGVEASFMLIRDILANPKLQEKYKDIVICVIPYYNIGGSLNRNSHSRANQNGPEEYGFRGNAKNYDLNRDFVKMDSKNAFAMAEIFTQWKPLVFFDNHVSNGADYQYTLTYLATQEDKLGALMGAEQRELNSLLEVKMKKDKTPIIPYVNVWGRSPDNGGIQQFYDAPRYSSGYAAMHQAYGYTVETHMLKPFEDRVRQTFAFMKHMLDILSERGDQMLEIKNSQVKAFADADSIAVNWELDTNRNTEIEFKGYELEYIPSEVSGAPRMFYNREKPFSKKIPYYGFYKPSKSIAKPKYYIIPVAWENVNKRLAVNGILGTRISSDTSISVEATYIESYETMKAPFEGHYMHYNTKVRRKQMEMSIAANDYYLIEVNSQNAVFLLSVLEPEASDSYFNWNFFDIYLQQKEGYSAYVFEDKAAAYLNSNPELKARFEDMKKNTDGFADNPQWQLYWIYQQTEHYEQEHMRVPIFRVE